jgi:hypothetical protein
MSYLAVRLAAHNRGQVGRKWGRNRGLASCFRGFFHPFCALFPPGIEGPQLSEKIPARAIFFAGLAKLNSSKLSAGLLTWEFALETIQPSYAGKD